MNRWAKSVFVVIAATVVTISSAYSSEPTAPNRFDWTGIYLGGHAGGIWSDVDQTSVGGAPHYFTAGQTVSLDPSGTIGGGHLGANYQTGNIVIGAEVSYSSGNIDDGVRAVGAFVTSTFDTDLSNLFLATARLGYAENRWLAYIKGGFASARVETNVTEAPAFAHSGASKERHAGWVIGTGFEYAFTKSIIFGVEYNYIDLESKSHGIIDTNPLGATETIRVDPDSISMLTARLSWKF